ncbi:MAG: alkaline phosphatase D family protein, partial [Candidatus Hydrogenedentes bacterium]|nr:alkaline phosphatase D family protein [Candidatus Hydrogenedentota bacterium]
ADTSETHTWEGTIRRDPVDRDEITVAAFTGHKIYTGTPMAFNSSAIWFPHNELVAATKHHNPDFLFFSGDQIYESDYTGAQREPIEKAILDYLDKWYRWYWVFGDLARDVPSVAIPDDHDVYHGNIWGAGGRHADKQDDGGFTMPPRFVNMVQRTQVSHLPDPVDPAPVEQGITVYFTDLVYGGINFAILEDRKFKSSPTAMIPEGDVVNGFFHHPDFDPATQADVEGAVLLGERQLKFLNDWANSDEGAVKVALSQTVFNNVSTLPRDFDSDKGTPGLPPVPRDHLSDDYKLIADADSNGWPQTGRNAAVRALRKANAFHLCGDQHLGIVVRYGVDDWNDAGYAFCVPAIGNTWPRRWYPPMEGKNRDEDRPPYTGAFKDAFGNYMTILAAANPLDAGIEPADLYNRAPGYGIVRINKPDQSVRIECWPRWVDPSKPGAEQYPDWPVTVHLKDGSVEY